MIIIFKIFKYIFLKGLEKFKVKKKFNKNKKRIILFVNL